MYFPFPLCIYYYAFTNGFKSVLANLPILVILLPTIPVAIASYLIYLVASPIQDIISFIFPSIVSVVPAVLLVLGAGLTRGKLLDRLFKQY